jgi:hypothetical protein
MSPIAAEDLKTRFALREMSSILRDCKPKSFPKVLTQYAVELNKPAVEWMEKTPGKKLPSDYKLYPGKMDHASCAGFIVRPSPTRSVKRRQAKQ